MAKQIIRVHTAEGTVYARVMEPTKFPFQDELMYTFIGPINVPAGLDQQGAVDHFRARGWTVQQDHGTDFDHPEWGE